jgi:hypothetical protein
VRLFALIGALLITGGVYLLVDGGLRLNRCLENDVFSVKVWTKEFWLFMPHQVSAGLSPNAHWFLRLMGGILAAAVGSKVLRVATR